MVGGGEWGGGGGPYTDHAGQCDVGTHLPVQHLDGMCTGRRDIPGGWGVGGGYIHHNYIHREAGAGVEPEAKGSSHSDQRGEALNFYFYFLSFRCVPMGKGGCVAARFVR